MKYKNAIVCTENNEPLTNQDKKSLDNFVIPGKKWDKLRASIKKLGENK